MGQREQLVLFARLRARRSQRAGGSSGGPFGGGPVRLRALRGGGGSLRLVLLGRLRDQAAQGGDDAVAVVGGQEDDALLVGRALLHVGFQFAQAQHVVLAAGDVQGRGREA